jgi:curli biogenesis system outer membrane secretion channel CsgG
MKNTIKYIATVLVVAIFAALAAGCTSSPSPEANQASHVAQSVQSGLPGALNRSSQEIMASLNKQENIAIINVSSNDREMAQFVAEELEVILVQNKFILVDRGSLDKIRQEQRFQLSGEVDDSSAVSIGKFAGAKVVIVGSITGADSTRRLRLRALNTEDARVIGAVSEAF